MNNKKFFKREWISVAILKHPLIQSDKIHKGALILNQVDPLIEMYPSLKKYFFIIERHGWFGQNEATLADIMLVDDLRYFDAIENSVPNTIALDISTADFVDTESFFPAHDNPEYDVLQISCWSNRKRIELLIEAASRLPEVKFVHLGHFENNGIGEELIYRDNCIRYASDIADNIIFLASDKNCNEDLPNTKKEINILINKTKLGVLTTEPEGVNRFKMECLAAGKPCLVPDDAGPTTQKHINPYTGLTFKPDPLNLASAIDFTLSNIQSFKPREYLLEAAGAKICLQKLKAALLKLCESNNQTYLFDDIFYDGRNESLQWGDNAIATLDQIVSNYP